MIYNTQYGEILEAESSDEDEVLDVPIREKLESRVYLARITANNNILWKQTLDNDDNADDNDDEYVTPATAAIESEDAKHFDPLSSIPCLLYRSMLLSCPYTTTELFNNAVDIQWIRYCMRSILSAALHNNSQGSVQPLQISFPALTYRFFDAPVDDSSTIVEGVSLEPFLKNQTKSPDTEAEKHWKLYYGVKEMACTDSEASLFFQLLDQSHGQDFQSMLLQVLADVNNEIESFHASVTVKADAITIPVDLALKLISKTFTKATQDDKKTSSALNQLTEETLSLAQENTTSSERKSTLHVDVFKWILLVIAKAFRQELRIRKSFTRLLFETASTGALTAYVPRQDDKRSNKVTLKDDECIVNFPQFEAIMKVLWESIEQEEVDELYRIAFAHTQNDGRFANEGVSLKAFYSAADERRFFTRSR